MTLRRKMAYQIAAMIVALLLVSGAALWGLNGLHEDYGVALEGYQRLRQVYEAGSHLATAQRLLATPNPLTLSVAREEIAAAHAYEQLPPPGRGWGLREKAADEAVREGLRDLLARAESPPPGRSKAQQTDDERDAITAVLSRMPQLASGIRHTTESRQADADAKRHATMLTVALLSGAVVVGGLIVGVLQYRGVMRPLGRLTEGVRNLAAGRFSGRVEPRGGAEFAALAHEFNRMAAELDGFYRELEQKVAAKSKELIRSERLASVGFLAAGVAHEINNPLGIISGYAEYSLSELRARPGHKPAAAGNGAGDASTTPDAEIEKSLQVICDEAFRCKEITGKLLSLARPGDDNRRPVSLADVASSVASVVGGLRQFKDRKLTVRAAPPGGLVVQAVEAEMKQVLLNLTLNALEAVPPGTGEVRIDVRRDAPDGQWVELSVTDNGRGMSQETLERVFEPFFTEKRGSRASREDRASPQTGHGTGLGLSITHAIVESHGGRIEAHSDGPGKGSRFSVRLPAAREDL